MATVKKIYTLWDARKERMQADAEMEYRHSKRVKTITIWQVLDANGRLLGNCTSEARAKAFIRDSLNTTGWTVLAVRS